MAPKLSDKAFAHPGKVHPRHNLPRRLTAEQKLALRGISSEQSWALEQAAMLLGRATVDSLLGKTASNGSPHGDESNFCQTCNVFVTPEGGKCPFCEDVHLVKQEDAPDPIGGVPKVVKNEYKGSLRPLGRAQDLDSTTLEIRVAYNRSYGAPASDDLNAYVAHRFPGYRIIDGFDRGAGVARLVIRQAQMSDHAPVVDAADTPAGQRRHNPDSYGGTVYGEEVDGTGKIGQAMPPPADPGAAPTDAPPMGGGDMPPGDPTDPSAMPPEPEMSMEDAVELAPQVMDKLVESLENGETLLHGQDVEPVEQPGELTPSKPGIGVPPLQEGAMPVAGMLAEVEKEAGVRLTKEARRLVLGFMVSDRYIRTAQAEEAGQPPIPELVQRIFSEYSTNPRLAYLVFREITGYIVKHPDILRQLTDYDQQKILTYAFSANPRIMKKFNRIMDMKTKNKPDQTPSTPPGKGQSESQEEHTDVGSAKEAAKFKDPALGGQLDDAVKVEDMKDRGGDRSIMLRPAHIGYQLDKVWQSGAYTFWRIKWDADNQSTQKMSPASITNDLKSFVQRVTSERDQRDWGFPGRMQVQDLDVEAGMAEIFFLTQKPGDAPLTVTQAET
jgi:hypothetical protein